MKKSLLSLMLFAVSISAEAPKAQIVIETPISTDESLHVIFKGINKSQAQQMLIDGICAQDIQLMRRALMCGADIYDESNINSPLMVAVMCQKYESIRYLLAQDITVDEDIIEYAVTHHDIKAVILLVNNGRARLSMHDFSHLIFNSKNAHLALNATHKGLCLTTKLLACKLLAATDYVVRKTQSFVNKPAIT